MDRRQLWCESKGCYVAGSVQALPDLALMGILEDFKIISLLQWESQDSEANSLQTSQGYEGKQLSQDPKLGPSYSKIYIFRIIPIFHRRKPQNRKMDVRPWGPDMHTAGSPNFLVRNRWLVTEGFGLHRECSLFSLFSVGLNPLRSSLTSTDYDLWIKSGDHSPKGGIKD